MKKRKSRGGKASELYVYEAKEIGRLPVGNESEDTVSFYCPKHGHEEEWTAQYIVEKGTPICYECDKDMVAKP